MKHPFAGQITLWTDKPELPGPHTLPVDFRALFGPPGHWQVQAPDFGDQGRVVLEDIDIGTGTPLTLTVKLAQAATGRYDGGSGQASLEVALKFTHPFFSSTLSLRLDTACHALAAGAQQHCGAPWLQGAQALRLAAPGQLVGGPLGGLRCVAVLAGQFQTAPW